MSLTTVARLTILAPILLAAWIAHKPWCDTIGHQGDWTSSSRPCRYCHQPTVTLYVKEMT